MRSVLAEMQISEGVSVSGLHTESNGYDSDEEVTVPLSGVHKVLTGQSKAAEELARAQALLEERKDKIGFNRIISDVNVAKVSVVGMGMKSHGGVAALMFKTLADRGINVQAISTSEIKISVLIDADETELAVRVLHSAYGLDSEEAA